MERNYLCEGFVVLKNECLFSNYIGRELISQNSREWWK